MNSIKVKIGNTMIEAEVADGFFKKAKGLMFRDSLDPGKGMLFVFDKEAKHAIWMLGMRFPIDIIWIGREMCVVDFAENAKPSLLPHKIYKPRDEARYVLEVGAGFVKENYIKIGSKLDFLSRVSSFAKL